MTTTFGYWQRTSLVAAIAILAGLGAQPLKAATVSVGSCITGGIHFATIQAAVSAVQPDQP